jgi:hypothetical protein
MLKKIWIIAFLCIASTAQAALNIQHWTLPNGARVYFVENHTIPILDVNVDFDAGGRRDAAGKSGMASLTNAMLARGIAASTLADGSAEPAMTEAQISDAIADIAAQRGGGAGTDRAGMAIRTLSSKAEREQAIALLARLLAQPAMPSEFIARDKARTIAAIREALTKPESIASKAFWRLSYGDHPYGMEATGELDEYAWEERLKESDRLTDAYQEVLEKYMEDPDSERKEAFAMGWDGLLDALAEREEAELGGYAEEDADHLFGLGGCFGEEDDDEDEDEDDGQDYGGEDDCHDDCGIPFDEDDSHPLQARAQDVARRAVDLASQEAGPGSASYRLLNNLLQVSGKLAGALNGRGSGYEPETGFVLAVLKRCLNWLNEAVGACNELLETETDPDQRAAYERLRRAAFEIRDGIVELRRELK